VGGRALTGGPGSVSDRGGRALTERAQHQGVWALTGGPRHQGARARSGILGSGSFDQDRMEGVRGGPSRSIKIGRGKSDWEG
jgi:hypothetical protein